MRLDIFGVVLATVATVTADAFVGLTLCIAPNCNTVKAAWFTDTDSYSINGNEGCRTPRIPGIDNVCFDWGKRRLHFDMSGGGTRCMIWQAGRQIAPCAGAASQCYMDTFQEVGCSW
ncbi:hypothetical protein B0T18DRAFT_384924 [Schizothecium vesticola]|uniref:Uncharacterized protein n=1 Tax=Schizothecium vesticola TaxID=314040 RepID=A0AA40F7P0_9PEZI|nr:hypothetical protein B0T18DRAFT_384924 [Schizothecium vesticola]